jgi:hypothetical protein
MLHWKKSAALQKKLSEQNPISAASSNWWKESKWGRVDTSGRFQSQKRVQGAGLPDAILSCPKSLFLNIFDGLWMKNFSILWSLCIFRAIWYIWWSFGIFYVIALNLVLYILLLFGILCGHWVYTFPFWYVVPRTIWQPRPGVDFMDLSFGRNVFGQIFTHKFGKTSNLYRFMIGWRNWRKSFKSVLIEARAPGLSLSLAITFQSM